MFIASFITRHATKGCIKLNCAILFVWEIGHEVFQRVTYKLHREEGCKIVLIPSFQVFEFSVVKHASHVFFHLLQHGEKSKIGQNKTKMVYRIWKAHFWELSCLAGRCTLLLQGYSSCHSCSYDHESTSHTLRKSCNITFPEEGHTRVIRIQQ